MKEHIRQGMEFCSTLEGGALVILAGVLVFTAVWANTRT
jgi:hypothetical protein